MNYFFVIFNIIFVLFMYKKVCSPPPTQISSESLGKLTSQVIVEANAYRQAKSQIRAKRAIQAIRKVCVAAAKKSEISAAVFCFPKDNVVKDDVYGGINSGNLRWGAKTVWDYCVAQGLNPRLEYHGYERNSGMPDCMSYKACFPFGFITFGYREDHYQIVVEWDAD